MLMVMEKACETFVLLCDGHRHVFMLRVLMT